MLYSELDPIDRRIIAALQADGRLTNVELADRVGLSPSPCLRRVKRLEREGYIEGYRAMLRRGGIGLGRASHCWKAQPIDPILLLNFAAERYWVQNVMTQILAIVWVPSWFHTYSIVFPRRAQYVECTQYMATRTAILNVGIVLNQCLEEIAKEEAPPSRR